MVSFIAIIEFAAEFSYGVTIRNGGFLFVACARASTWPRSRTR